MAFGIPTVIGVLSSSTSQTTYSVPITGIPPSGSSTTSGDCITVIVGVNGNGSNAIPNSVSDSKNQQYQQNVPNNNGSGQLTVWQFFDSAVLSNTDTITVTFPVANTQLKNIIVLDCPGVGPSPLAIDQASINTNSGSSNNPTVSSTLTSSYELVIFAEQNGNLGTAPANFSPFTLLSTQHSGSNQYTSVAYQIVNSSGSVTGSCQITSASWATTIFGMTVSIPIYFQQYPFPPLPSPALSYNPALSQIRPQLGLPAVPTVISSAPVNISGAQANIFPGIINFLTGNANNFSGTTGGWTNGGNTTIAQTNSVSHNAAGALQITATSSGATTVHSSTATKLAVNALPVQPGDTVVSAAWILAATTGRLSQSGLSFFDINGNQIGSTTFGNSITDSIAAWTLLPPFSATAPAGASYARSEVQINGNGAGEVHYISDAWLANLTYSLPANPGNQISIYTPCNQQFQLQPDGVPYPLSAISQLQNLPRQIQTAIPTVFQPGVACNITVNAQYPDTTPAIYQTFTPQYPFAPDIPSPLYFNPAFAGIRQQINTAAPFTYVDGGTPSQVVVNAQFPDIAVIISVSVTSNVTVVAPSPPVVIKGITSSVNVTSSGQTINAARSGVTANASVLANPGTIVSNVIGTIANVTTASTGTVKVSPNSGTIGVSVAAIGGSINIVTPGPVSNVSTASSGTVAESPRGVQGQVSVSAQPGTIKESVTTTANINVVSSGATAVTLIGSTGSVSIVANSGFAGLAKVVNGVTANVQVSSAGIVTTSISGTPASIFVVAPAGITNELISAQPASINVAAFAGPEGTLSITGTLISTDLALDQILSDQGKLLDVPVTNILLSASNPLPRQGT